MVLFRKIAITVIFGILLHTACLSNDIKVADSIQYYLKKVEKSSDTASLNAAYEWMDRNTSENLGENPSIRLELNRLKAVLPELNYVQLLSEIILSTINTNLTSLSKPSIRLGKDFISQYINTTSLDIKATVLVLMRELRRPFRNGNQVYEGIEYIDSLNKEFLTHNDSAGITITYNMLAGFYNRIGLEENGKYFQLKSIEYLDDRQGIDSKNPMTFMLGKYGKLNRYAVLGSYGLDMNKPAEAEFFLEKAIEIYQELDSPMLVTDAPFMFLQMARCKTSLNSDSSIYYYEQALHYFKIYNSTPLEIAHYYQEKGADCLRLNQLDSAIGYLDKCISLRDSLDLEIASYMGELIPNYYKALVFVKQNKPGNAIQFLISEIEKLKIFNLRKLVLNELRLLSKCYFLTGNDKAAYRTLEEATTLGDLIVQEEAIARKTSFELEKKMQQNEIRIAQLESKDKSSKKARLYFVGIIVLLGLSAVTLLRGISQKQKSNRRLGSKNDELSQALNQLQTTQKQLLHSEKMASLGELTAGIAHEIQNPLNFVNNFSEINVELLGELKEGPLKNLPEEDREEVNKIISDLDLNMQKIGHHGKRADGIVKGMLLHSRNNSGQKELTDINALSDEYLRLAYHGLRAKDKSFNATLETDFDKKIDLVKVVPQEIGRVILNLINNAFYAVDEKTKLGLPDYQPTVSIKTKKNDNSISIFVKDNGNGIPQKVIDKIFQPFFSTKPTGQGTGLGLSMSYDIVKAHGGEIEVESREGEGTDFIVEIPL